jgi:uncharacterized protein YlaN (UPF0358 family)
MIVITHIQRSCHTRIESLCRIDCHAYAELLSTHIYRVAAVVDVHTKLAAVVAVIAVTAVHAALPLCNYM